MSPESSAGICANKNLCNAQRVCVLGNLPRCIPATDLIVNHQCIDGACLLLDVVYETTWTASVCDEERLCFGCFAAWSQSQNRFICTFGQNPAATSLMTPIFPGECSSLAHLHNGRESLPLGIPALLNSPGSCEHVISNTAVLLFVDGWNPFHQVLQTFRLLFQSLASFSGNFAEEASTGFTDCTVLLSKRNTIGDVGPFGVNVLRSFCRHGILELRNLQRVCFSRLLLGSTPGGWDMDIEQTTFVPINFAGIHMAQWIKRSIGFDSSLHIGPQSKPMVTLVLRRGRREIFNEDDVVQIMTCTSAHQTCLHTLVAIDLDQSTFREAVALVSSSAVLIGVHGAGLTNLIFLPAGRALVELQLARSRPVFRNLCRSFGKIHFEFVGTRMILPPATAQWSMLDDRDLILYVRKPSGLAHLVSNAISAVRRREPACC